MIYIALSLTSIVFFIAYIIIATSIYKKEKRETFDLRNHYAFELFIKRDRPYAFINVLLFISLAVLFANYLLFTIYNFGAKNVLISLAALFASISSFISFYLPPYKLKYFLSNKIFVTIFTAMINFMFIFVYFQDVNFKESIYFYFALVFSIVFGLICLVGSFFININDLRMEHDEETLIRPKIIKMALFEWLAIIILPLSQIGIILLSLV